MCARNCLLLILIASVTATPSWADQPMTLGQLVRAVADEMATSQIATSQIATGQIATGQPDDSESTADWLDGDSDLSEPADGEGDSRAGEASDADDADSTATAASVDLLSRLHKPIGQIQVASWEVSGRVPQDRAAELLSTDTDAASLVTATGQTVPGPMRYTVGAWHRPLYFQQPNLERCGNSIGYFQNALSGAQFLCNTLTLPVHMIQRRPDCPIDHGVDCQTCERLPIDGHPVPERR